MIVKKEAKVSWSPTAQWSLPHVRKTNVHVDKLFRDKILV